MYGFLDLIQLFFRYGGIGLVLALGAATPIRILAVHAVIPAFVASIALLIAARSLFHQRPAMQGVTGLFHLVKWYWATIALGSLISRMDILFVSSFGGSFETGLFAAAKAMAIAPQLIGMYMSVVASPKIMPMWVNDSFFPIFSKLQAGLIVTALVLFLSAFLTRGIWVQLLPNSFTGAAWITLWLLPAALCALIDFPLTVPFLLFARPRLLLFFDLAFFPFLCIGYYWIIPVHGALGAAIITTVYALLKTVFFQTTAWSIARQGPAETVLQEIITPSFPSTAKRGMALRSL
jgi:O-antigen/teichoic acid export membrane protein